MKLYGHPMSTCTRKVLTVLDEKGHKAEMTVVDIMKGEGKNPDHLARQPFGQVPAIDDDGFVLYESRAIIRYLDETLSGAKLTPADPKGRALMEQWISVETSDFTPNAMKIIFQKLFHPMMGKPVDETVVKEATVPLDKALAVVDRQLAKTKFLVGDKLTLADVGFMPYIEYLFAGGSGDIVSAHKNVARWWGELSARPSWQKATGKATG